MQAAGDEGDVRDRGLETHALCQSSSSYSGLARSQIYQKKVIEQLTVRVILLMEIRLKGHLRA